MLVYGNICFLLAGKMSMVMQLEVEDPFALTDMCLTTKATTKTDA